MMRRRLSLIIGFLEDRSKDSLAREPVIVDQIVSLCFSGEIRTQTSMKADSIRFVNSSLVFSVVVHIPPPQTTNTGATHSASKIGQNNGLFQKTSGACDNQIDRSI
eukprot:m.117183 g.117183  ORF g.117183 m.117183 type:complete len:106 (-) comp13176_c0_seq5:1951-2268(-)